MARFIGAFLLAAAVSGCSPAPSQSEVVTAVRDGMRMQHGVELVSFDIKKSEDGTWSGTARDANGTKYLVSTTKADGSKFNWSAASVVDREEVERVIRAEMAAKMNVTLKSLDLKELPPHDYEGTGTDSNGDAFEVSAQVRNGIVNWKAYGGKNWVEKKLRGELAQRYKGVVKSIDMIRNSPETFAGTAVFADGRSFIVTTYLEGNEMMWKALPVAGN